MNGAALPAVLGILNFVEVAAFMDYDSILESVSHQFTGHAQVYRLGTAWFRDIRMFRLKNSSVS
jgi:hypothetical protein